MNIAVILLSGKGNRMGVDTPKQFLMVNKKPLYLYSVHAFYTDIKIDRLLLVTNEEYVESVKADLKKYGYIKKPIEVISGGKERYLSVKNAVKALQGKKYSLEDKVLIHDGVRPNITKKIIDDNISALNIEPCVLTAIEVPIDYNPFERVDTIHLLHNKKYRAQTPQSFKLSVLKEIYNKVDEYDPYPFTDDISLAIANNYQYVIVDGSENNYKITRQEDLERFIKENK